MRMLRIFRRTITITSTETWTVSVESDQLIELPSIGDQQPVRDDVPRLLDAPDPSQTTGKQSDEE